MKKTFTLTAENIQALEKVGASRWTKYGKDRIYLSRINPEALGFTVSRYNTGNISQFLVDGEKVSNANGARIINALDGGFFDLQTGELLLTTDRDNIFKVTEEGLKKVLA